MNFIKIKYWLVVFFGITMFSCDQKNTLTFPNAKNVQINAKNITLKTEDLSGKWGALPAGERWIPYLNDTIVPFQYDDINGDGKIDELFFQLDFEAGQDIKVEFKSVDKSFDFPVSTNIYLGKKSGDSVIALSAADRLQTWNNTVTQGIFQFEGPGWENDKVAFRNYFDLRNGIDIFGKRKSEMVLENIGARQTDDYHSLSDWGMDVLKVGESLGAGSIALLYKDSLVRLTSKKADFKIIAKGPLRSIFDLSFDEVDLGDKKVNAVHRIEIQKGKWYYQSSLVLSDTSNIKVVTGIVNLHKADPHITSGKYSTILSTYALQTENNDYLGMAIEVPNDLFIKVINTDSISKTIPSTYAVIMKPLPVVYRFYSAWELSDDQFTSQEGFEKFLSDRIDLVF